MNFGVDKAKKRILGRMLPQFMGQSVCLLGSLVQLEPSGKVLKMKTSDDQLISVQLQQPRTLKMKVINLSAKDPDIFQTVTSPSRREFVINHFESFMQMYKSQRSTFWLRFLMSFKDHTEEKIYTNKKWFSLLCNYQYHFLKALNYVYVCIHKKFIEGSNTAVKKFINNLLALALHSPTYLDFPSTEEWINYLKSLKQIQTTFQNVSGISDPCEYGAYTLLIFTVYTDFFCALCSVFEQWSEKKDLSDDEFKRIDTKIIYWLPNFHSNCKFKPLCFERYLLDYWKGDLNRLLLCDDIQSKFGSHNTSGCCENYIKEKNLMNSFPFPSKHVMELMEFMFRENDSDEEDECDDVVSTITEVCLQDVCLLKPHAKHCTQHKNCYVRIFHDETCSEPFLCPGSSPCVLTCETNSKDVKKEKKVEKFWKNISVEKFPINDKKSEASTVAESNENFIETYLHAVENTDSEMQHFSAFKHTYQCLSEFHKFDFNPRRTECLNRLRKKLTLKHPSNTYQFNFRQPFYRESLLENADRKMFKLQVQSCSQRNHNFLECSGKCFLQDVNSIAIDSCNAFGRVISLTKTCVPVPPICHKHLTESIKSECISEENFKSPTHENKSNKNEENIKPPGNGKKSDKSEENIKPPGNGKKSDKSEENIKPPGNGKKFDKSEENIKPPGNGKKSDKSEEDTKQPTNGKKSNKSEENLKPPANGKKSGKSEETMKLQANEKKSVKCEEKMKAPANEKKPDRSEEKVKAMTNEKKSDKSENINSPASGKKSDKKSKSKNAEKNKIATAETVTNLNEEKSNIHEKKLISTDLTEEPNEICDDEIEEILKLIGINDGQQSAGVKTSDENQVPKNSAKEDEAVENFFKLIGVKTDESSSHPKSDVPNSLPKDDKKLKVCAYCKKRETQRKMFKKCSKCREENFPVQHYYCSQECLRDDWFESHEKEHLKFKKVPA